MKKIVACGCSWTHGFYWKDQQKGIFDTFISYPEVLGKMRGYEVINLSKPGTSNYGIVKQIEYAMNLDPALIVFNIAHTPRIDLKKSGNTLFENNKPTLKDFNYDNYVNEHTKDFNGKIHSTIFNSFITKCKDVEDPEEVARLVTYYEKYVGLDICRDQSRFLILGILNLLIKNKVSYVGIDCAKIMEPNDDSNILAISAYEQSKKFPTVTDPLHFNQDGHNDIANQLNELLIKHNF